MSQKIRVTVWNENLHEKKHEAVQKVYPDGIHSAIANLLKGQSDFEVRTATLDQPQNGLPEEVLAATDVLTWWGHMGHNLVEDATVERVWNRIVKDGLGLIVLHSGHFSKIFKKLMGTTCDLKWREVGEKERVWVVQPGHPIAAGLPEYFEFEHAEMYGEHFDIPQPEEQIFISWFAGGEVFRSGCTWHRGRGKVFYFNAGHETYPAYYDPIVGRVLANSVRWAAPCGVEKVTRGNFKPLEKI